MLAYAIHKIRRRVGDKRRIEDPRSVFECDAAEYAELEAVGAVRKPEEAEEALYERRAARRPSPAPAPAPAPAETAAQRKKREAAERAESEREAAERAESEREAAERAESERQAAETLE